MNVHFFRNHYKMNPPIFTCRVCHKKLTLQYLSTRKSTCIPCSNQKLQVEIKNIRATIKARAVGEEKLELREQKALEQRLLKERDVAKLEAVHPIPQVFIIYPLSLDLKQGFISSYCCLYT